MFKPFSNYVLLERTAAEEKTAGGIYIPETAKEKPSEGTVIAVGPGRHTDAGLQPMECTVGATVLFPRWAGVEIKLDGTDYVVIKEEELFGKITGDK